MQRNPQGAARGFEIICELEPPSTADLHLVGDQLAALGDHCDAFLVPDSHMGRATVSSLAVATEIRSRGHRAVVCLNARDRNLVGLRRDLLTATTRGLTELLFVYGDDPEVGDRSSLTVRAMLEEVARQRATGTGPAWSIGVAGDVRRPLPAFKRDADRVLTQLCLDAGAVEGWVGDGDFAGRVYAGVIVLSSPGMADRLEHAIPGFAVPGRVRRRLRDEPDGGIRVAVELVGRLRAGGIVDGVHLVAAGRHRDLAAALARL